ncbi:MAG: hypothetical protein IJO34_08125 [Akkermansia sp.]|nr:hypothetical protein [Akkermansia sp.]
MARKLTIRRVGGCLPALSLVVLLLFCMTIGWLSIIGLPQDLLRYLEKEVATQGIHLKLDAIKLDPRYGIAFRAEGLRLYSQEKAESPLAKADSFTLGVNVSRMFTGVLSADTIILRNGAVYLPTRQEENKKLVLDKINLSATLTRRQIARLTAANMQLQGIPIRLRGSYDLTTVIDSAISVQEETQAPQPTEPIDLEKTLQDYVPAFDTIYRYLTSQQWAEDEKPDLELQLHSAGSRSRYSFKLNVPKYDWKQFHFRNATADITYRNDTITIHSLRFHTVEPDSTASLQGGFSIPDKNLSFTMESDVDLLNMVQPFLDEETVQTLQKFSYPEDKAPGIHLRGDIVFAQNWIPEQARIRGSMGVEQLAVGSSQINKIELSFLYHNGDFNVDKLSFVLPSGTADLTATARDGQGEADAEANIHIGELLQLINQFTDKPITLPEGMQLYGNIRIAAQAKLTTLPLNASQEEWENYVPSCSHLQVELSTDQITYHNHNIAHPQLKLRVGNISQGRNKIPKSIDSAKLNLSADDITLAGNDETAPTKLSKLSLNLACNQINLEDKQARIEKLQLDAALEKGESGSWQVTNLSIPQLKIEGLQPLEESHKMFRHAAVEMQAEQILHDGVHMGRADFSCELPESTTGTMKLMVKIEGKRQIRLSATPNWSNADKLVISDIKAHLPLADYLPVLERFGIKTEEMEFPKLLTADGTCTWDTKNGQLDTAQVKLDIPELVRTPHKVPAFKDKRIPIGLKADAGLHSSAEGGIVYEADLHVSHKTGEFVGKATGNTNSHVHVTGNNTIRADIIDQLIDNHHAHSIIRDFRFNPRSRTIVTNINTKVRYDNGVIVDSYCDALIQNAEYLMGVLYDKPDKTEAMRTDLGKNPYTYTKRATCGVVVDVRMDSKDASGQKLKDKICITLTNPKLLYDNGPWLSRRNFKTGTAETTLAGKAVIIDVENSFVELRDVKGTVYPAYSIGMFYADIQHFMEDIVLPVPAQVETASCVFPIYSDCKRPMSGTIRAIAPKGAAFNFLGTSIPLSDFSGFIYLTDDYVQLDKLNAKSWGGVLDAVVRIGFKGKHTSFDGFARASNMDLHHIAAAYGSVQAYALCNGYIRFRSPSPNINDIQAYGNIDITNGDLLSLSLFRPVSSYVANLPANLTKLEGLATRTGVTKKPGVLSRMVSGIYSAFQRAADSMGDGVDKIVYYVPGANHLLSYDLQEASAQFTIGKGHLTTTEMHAIGHNLDVLMNMNINLDNMEIHGNIWPKVSSLPTIILSPLTFLSDFMVDIVIHGPVDNLDWHFALDRRLSNQKPSATSETPPNNPEPVKY